MSIQYHTLKRVCEPPYAQCRQLLWWFHGIGVERFDLHIRRYPREGDRSHEEWITCHEGISTSEIISFWSWMRRENANGADIYFRPHGAASHPVIFIDDLDLPTSRKIAKAYASAVVQTSPNNTQVWIQTDRSLDVNERKQAQANLTKRGFGDPGSTSGDHLGRMCGFFSQKRRSWVNLILFSTPEPTVLHERAQHLTQGVGGRVSCPLKVKSPQAR